MNILKHLYFFIFLLFIECVFTYPRKNEDHFCKVHGIRIREGEALSIPGHCKTVKCLKASTGKTSTLECSMFILVEGCKSTEVDYTKSFPTCCPHSIC
ncbi:hypothetical protein RN001_006542 [Aquatica leii]|uniref:Single domain-containing protein n=1 Tax=Aquatica leii TaxID=1421715 RepID=A0AAN7PE72_9COLE|nr:hypothetical protein RN001_006542 [Aquatica leii]